MSKANVVGRAVVRTDDAMLAVFDQESPANVAGHYQKALTDSWGTPAEASHAASGAWSEADRRRAEDNFEQYWRHRGGEGAVLVWRPGSGVHRVELRLAEAGTSGRRQVPVAGFLVSARGTTRLRCPSGRIVVSALRELGVASLVPTLTVAAGHYKVSLDRAVGRGAEGFVLTLRACAANN